MAIVHLTGIQRPVFEVFVKSLPKDFQVALLPRWRARPFLIPMLFGVAADRLSTVAPTAFEAFVIAL